MAANSSPFASELSQQVLERRLRLGELAAPQLNERNRRTYPRLAVLVTPNLVPQQMRGQVADAIGLGEVAHEG